MRTRELVLGRYPISAFLLLLSLFISSTTSATIARGPLRVSLGYSGTPEPGQSFTVICSVSCDIDTTCVSNSFLTLPVGMTTGGSTEYESESGDGVIDVQQFTVTAPNAGIYEIKFRSTAIVDSTYGIGDCVFLNLCVSSDIDSMGVTTISGDQLPDGSFLMVEDTEAGPVEDYGDGFMQLEPMPADSIPDQGEPGDSLYGGPAQSPTGTVYVSGRVKFACYSHNDVREDFPLVNATVYVWDSDTFIGCGDDELLAVTITDDQGMWHAWIDNGDCDGTADVYFQVRLDNSVIHVSQMPSVLGPIGYKFNGGTVDNVGSEGFNFGEYFAGGTAPGPSQRACVLFTSLNKAYFWTTHNDDPNRAPNGLSMGPVRAYYGTFIDSQVNHSVYSAPDLYIYGPDGEAGDSPQSDPADHIYAHAVQDWLGEYVGSCTEAFSSYASSTAQCAWEEGFADFFAVAIHEDDDSFFTNGNLFYNLEVPSVGHNHTVPSATALTTQAYVSRALYDLFDYKRVEDNDELTTHYSGQIGKDAYSSSVTSILDVLHDYQVGSFSTFWTKWALAGNPKHLPVQAIRYNEIDFNTVPVWTTVPAQSAHPGNAVNLNVNPYIFDAQSLDGEMAISVYSNSSATVTTSWPSPGFLRAENSAGSGSTTIVLSASDGLSTTNSASFTITWSAGGKGGEDPPDPCEGPCPQPGFVPQVTDLGPASPNPFNPSTSFFYDLESSSQVLVAIYDVAGRRIRTFVDGKQNRGRYDVTWNGTDSRGLVQPSGVYFILMRANGQQFTSKIVLIK